MHKTTYSIRKGFYYQDLYCALRLVELVESQAFAARFQIESDQVHFLDDLVLKMIDGGHSGHQVKFHTSQSHVDSFESFVEKVGPRSRSLLQKLYSGWRELSRDGEDTVEVVFVSSNAADTSEGNLAAAIDSASRKFGAAFFERDTFASARRLWSDNLGADDVQLRRFLECLTWRFGQYSIDDLRYAVQTILKRLRFPSHTDAVAVLTEVVGECATEKKEMAIRDWIHLLWERPTFRGV